ncbi:MAG: glycosyltransferase [Chloroflexota bacterium]
MKKMLLQLPFVRRLAASVIRFRDERILYNVNRAPQTASSRRALLAYIIRPFRLKPESEEFVAHQNNWAAMEIARLLGELGYIVDVINWNNHTTPIRYNYDLVIGFGRAEELARELPSSTVKIFLSTGSQVNFTRQRLSERLADIRRWRGCELQPVRTAPDRAEYLPYFDAIAAIGNTVTVETYRPYFSGKIYTWNNHGYDQWIGIPPGKNFEESRRNFLYFASSGQVLVGLDLVLEVFAKRPHLRLFVCGPFAQETDFVQCFYKELYETPNIMPVGWVVVGSEKYFELTRQCGMTIFPICAGGSPGSVITCMSQGLIPVVSKEAGMDTNDFGITLPSIRIEDIKQAVDWISNQPAEWHEATNHKVLEASRRDFSQAAFTKRFHEILVSIIEDKVADVSSSDKVPGYRTLFSSRKRDSEHGSFSEPL